MGTTTEISWTDHTFNPWIGCTKVAPGCQFCYAEALMDTRYGKVQWGPGGTRVVTSPNNWREPLKWNKKAEAAGVRAKVFCASLADVFEDWDGPLLNSQGEQLWMHPKAIPGDYINQQHSSLNQPRIAVTMNELRRYLFSVIDATPWLDWQLVTKRPENILRMWPAQNVRIDPEPYRRNVWLLTSVSNQETADKMIPELLNCHDLVPVLGVSYEPALGPVNFTSLATTSHWPRKQGPSKLNALQGYTYSKRERFVLNGIVEERGETDFVDIEPGRLDWIIVGGESGHSARPFNIEWARSTVQQCQAADVACFVKQLGAKPVEDVYTTEPWIIRDSKGGDWNEWPEDLRVRQFPTPSEVRA